MSSVVGVPLHILPPVMDTRYSVLFFKPLYFLKHCVFLQEQAWLSG